MFLSLSARAESITEDQARAKVQSFLHSRQSASAGKRLAPARTPAAIRSTPSGAAALYVFNVGEQDGFVIASGDDRTRSILGYTDSGSFNAAHVPAALSEMLAIYARQIEQLGQTSAQSGSAARARKSRHHISGQMADVAPLLTTTWDQGDPYNAYCPTLGNQTALTGCVATAMAQIAYYHRYPTTQVPSLSAYVSETNKLNVSAWGATTFDWDNMLPSYSGSYTNDERTAVATLMRYCGQAAQMDYGFTSGAYNGDALVAFKEKLGYNANAQFRSAAAYSVNGWEDLIYKEVSEHRPVYYSALNGDGSNGEVGGHAFVIDGYQADGNYFHVNWGWGGACNGFFNLFALDPDAPESPVTSTGWHYQMLAIVGLSPETVNTAKLSKDASGSWLITSADDWNELANNLEAYNGGSFKLTQDISVTTMVGTEGMPFSGTFDGQGHTLNLNIVTDLERTGPFHWTRNSTFKNLVIDGTLTTNNHGAAGLIGWAQNVTLQNCTSNVTITSSYEGDGTCAGFICLVRNGGPAYFYDCLFTGSIHGPNIDRCSGLCGWQDDGAYFFNCLNLGVLDIASNEDCATFCRNGAEVTNCYYISSVADYDRYRQGTAVTTGQLADGTITQKLQSGQRDWTTGLVWGQKIGTDATPMLTSDASKGIYKVSFAVDGQVVKSVFTNSPIGDKMPTGEDFGLTSVSFTYNGSVFTTTTAFSGDITVNVTGTAVFAMTLGTTANGSISINNNACIPGTLKKVTATPAAGYVVSAVTVTDAAGKALPVTPVSNASNEFVFAFPKSSVTVSAEFVEGEAEAVRFINGGMTLPLWRDQPWTADTWTIWNHDYQPILGTPPADALGHQWYEEGYMLTNSDTDLQPNGNKIVWENHTAPFGCYRNYDYARACGDDSEGPNNFYMRRIFTFNTETAPEKLYLACSYDDAPVQIYINGTLVCQINEGASSYSAELTPEQIALIHTDGTPNVLAARVSQGWGDYNLDCGIYDPTVFRYEVTSENTVRVLRNEFITGDVVIPEAVTYSGKTYTVTEMPDDATNDLPYVTSMSLPRTVTGLGTSVFANLPQLQWVKSYFPVYQVYDQKVLVAAPVEATAFEVDADCQRIWNNAFKFTDRLTTLTLPRSLTYVGHNAFVGCTSLTKMYSYARPVPETEGNAFDGIDKSKITLHVYASAIDSYKQAWGEEFQYVTMPDPQTVTLTVNVAEMGTLRSLIETAAEEKGSTIYDVTGLTVTGNINQDDLRTLAEMCRGVYALATIDLCGVTIDGNYIDNDMFRDCGNLTSIILPETLEYINDASFHNCDALTTIDIPASVKRLWHNAFSGCDNLTTVTGLEGLSESNSWEAWDVFLDSPITHPVYGGKVFLYMPSTMTGEYEVPAGITMTTADAFRYSQLSSVTLPASLTDLGDDTFRDCPNLVDIYCYATTPPTCHSGVWEFGFDRAACTVHVPASAVEDYQNADEWRDMGRIVGIVTGELADMTINVATAGTLDDALFDAAVAAAQISDKVLIRNLTVTGSINADDVAYLNTLPATLYNMSMLDLSGVTLADNAVTERMFYQTLYKTIMLPTTVTSIASETFRASRRLQEVTLPSTLEYIGSHAFAECGLTSITIPDGVTETGDRVLADCRSLKSITIGNGMTYIPDSWAEGCTGLEELTIGKNMKSISWYNFRGGAQIKQVYCYSKTPPQWHNSYNDALAPDAVLHVYENCVKRYQNANGWNEFPTIVGDLGTYPTIELAVNVPAFGGFSNALASAMTAAGCEDMSDITKLTVTGNMNMDDLNYLCDNVGRTLDKLDLSSVTVENNCFGDNTLSNCGFEELILPATLERLGGMCSLNNCVNLKTLDIPSSVKYLGFDFCKGATSLETVTGGESVVFEWSGLHFAYTPNLKSPIIFNDIFFRLPESTVGTYEVPNYVTTIIRDGLCFATGLTTLILPESINFIMGYAFADDVNLKDIYLYSVELPNIEGDTFERFDRSSCTLHVYEEMADLFKNDEMWKGFNIVGDLGSMPIITPMNEADYADLCNIAVALGGDSWRTKWITNTNVQTASRWRGVTFDADGYVTAIDLRENGLSGDISSLTFTGMTRLENLDLSGNAITGDIRPLAATLKSGCNLNIERQDLGYVGELTLYEACRLSDGLPPIAFYNSQSRTMVSTLIGVGGYCQFFHGGTDGGQYWDCYIYADGRTVNNNKFYWPSPTTVECVYPHHFTFTYQYETGDANMDDVLNVLDLQSTLNYSNNQSSGLFNFCAADTYGADDDINVQDIVTTVNILLAQEDAVQTARVRTFGYPVRETEATLSVDRGQIVLCTTKPVAALDLRIDGILPAQLSWHVCQMAVATATTPQGDGTRAILYSMQPQPIGEGRTVLATFDASLMPQLTAAVLSDSQARPVSVSRTAVTGISQTEDASSATDSQLYNLQGKRIESLPRKGLYIQNGKKVVIK